MTWSRKLHLKNYCGRLIIATSQTVTARILWNEGSLVILDVTLLFNQSYYCICTGNLKWPIASHLVKEKMLWSESADPFLKRNGWTNIKFYLTFSLLFVIIAGDCCLKFFRLTLAVYGSLHLLNNRHSAIFLPVVHVVCPTSSITSELFWMWCSIVQINAWWHDRGRVVFVNVAHCLSTALATHRMATFSLHRNAHS